MYSNLLFINYALMNIDLFKYFNLKIKNNTFNYFLSHLHKNIYWNYYLYINFIANCMIVKITIHYLKYDIIHVLYISDNCTYQIVCYFPIVFSVDILIDQDQLLI